MNYSFLNKLRVRFSLTKRIYQFKEKQPLIKHRILKLFRAHFGFHLLCVIGQILTSTFKIQSTIPNST